MDAVFPAGAAPLVAGVPTATAFALSTPYNATWVPWLGGVVQPLLHQQALEQATPIRLDFGHQQRFHRAMDAAPIPLVTAIPPATAPSYGVYARGELLPCT